MSIESGLILSEAFTHTRDFLTKIKLRSLRKGVWFRALSRLERMIADLTIKCVERARSVLLRGTIVRIVSKLLEALKSRFLSEVDALGRKLADRFGRVAQRLGFGEAMNWVENPDYMRYLGIVEINKPRIFRTCF
ncbi:MAG: hypothetical protein ACE5GD_01060 [Candidatus Geothermarchaeales archaeon]